MDYVQFYCHCSRTKQRFIVSGYVKDDILVWAAAFIPKPGTVANAPPALTRSYKGSDTSRFRCPCCEISGPPLQSTWRCADCNAMHCQGTDRAGLCHGACGTCAYPRSAFVPSDGLQIQLAQGHDR